MSQFPKSLLIAIAILLILLVGMGVYSVRQLGGAYRKTGNTLMDQE